MPSQGIFWTQGLNPSSCFAGKFFTIWATRETQEYLMGSLSLLQGNFLTQESNWGLLHCRRILNQLSCLGNACKLGWCAWEMRVNWGDAPWRVNWADAPVTCVVCDVRAAWTHSRTFRKELSLLHELSREHLPEEGAFELDVEARKAWKVFSGGEKSLCQCLNLWFGVFETWCVHGVRSWQVAWCSGWLPNQLEIGSMLKAKWKQF